MAKFITKSSAKSARTNDADGRRLRIFAISMRFASNARKNVTSPKGARPESSSRRHKSKCRLRFKASRYERIHHLRWLSEVFKILTCEVGEGGMRYSPIHICDGNWNLCGSRRYPSSIPMIKIADWLKLDELVKCKACPRTKLGRRAVGLHLIKAKKQTANSPL